MKDVELAEEIIKRLNEMLREPEIRKDIERLLEVRVPVSSETCKHESLRTYCGKLGALGLINGLIGAVDRAGPAIAGNYDAKGELLSFRLAERWQFWQPVTPNEQFTRMMQVVTSAHLEMQRLWAAHTDVRNSQEEADDDKMG